MTGDRTARGPAGATRPLAHLPGRIPWDPPAADGTRTATLHGNRVDRDPFSYAFLVPAGVWDAPHSHPVDAHVIVVQGTLLLGYGPVLDPAVATAHPAGSYLFVPAGALHFDGAAAGAKRDGSPDDPEDTIIIGVATGQWATTYAPGNG